MIKKKGKENFCWYYGYFLIHTNIMLEFFVLSLLLFFYDFYGRQNIRQKNKQETRNDSSLYTDSHKFAKRGTHGACAARCRVIQEKRRNKTG